MADTCKSARSNREPERSATKTSAPPSSLVIADLDGTIVSDACSRSLVRAVLMEYPLWSRLVRMALLALGFAFAGLALLARVGRQRAVRGAYRALLFICMRGLAVEKAAALANNHVKRLYAAGVHEKVLAELFELRRNGARVVVVTANVADVVEPFVSSLGFELFGTELEIRRGVYTGRLKPHSVPVLFDEKRRVLNRVRTRGNETHTRVRGYGNDENDALMLMACEERVCVNPDVILRNEIARWRRTARAHTRIIYDCPTR